jgi:hypothetical protein
MTPTTLINTLIRLLRDAPAATPAKDNSLSPPGWAETVRNSPATMYENAVLLPFLEAQPPALLAFALGVQRLGTYDEVSRQDILSLLTFDVTPQIPTWCNLNNLINKVPAAEYMEKGLSAAARVRIDLDKLFESVSRFWAINRYVWAGCEVGK